MNDKYVSVEIPYKATLASMVLGYASSFNNADSFNYNSPKYSEITGL